MNAEILKSGKIGISSLQSLSQQREQIIKNWGDSGLLDGLKGVEKTNVAQLLECDATGLLNEGDCCENCKENKKVNENEKTNKKG